jgi:hypothetical protein
VEGIDGEVEGEGEEDKGNEGNAIEGCGGSYGSCEGNGLRRPRFPFRVN